MSRRAPLPLAAVLLAASLFALAARARADYDPVASGQTKLRLDPAFVKTMKQNGVALSAAAPAKLRGTTVVFPAIGGKFDPTTARGTVEHEGALVLSANGAKVPIKALKLRTAQKSSPFLGKVGGSQLKLGIVKGLTIKRLGFGETVSAPGLRLLSKVTTRLGKKLKLRKVFNSDLILGNLTTTTAPSTVTVLQKGAATLTLAPGFVAKMQSLFVAINPVFPAEHQGAVFTLPIFGGDIALDASQGRLDTLGSLEFLQLGGGQVFWREAGISLDALILEPQLEIEPSPPYPGKVGSAPVAALAAAAPVAADPKALTVSASYGLTLGAGAAATFNEAFAKPQGKDGVFVPGEPTGSLSFVAMGQ